MKQAEMLVLGIDIGTSGVRTAVLDQDGTLVSTARAAHLPTSNEDANAWWDAAARAVQAQVSALHETQHNPHEIERIAIDGTSGSMVLVDATLNPVTAAMMYNSGGFDREAERIASHAEPGSITLGPSSALARMLRLQAMDESGSAVHLLHQADYVLAKLAGMSLGSDDNNALKLGWDPAVGDWPSWFETAGVPVETLPNVHRPGAEIGELSHAVADALGLAAGTKLHAGTTDSIAAFLASGATEIGDAVTSLGTTLAIKLLSDARVDDPASGVYSHLVNGKWLAGGASNTGGGVLAHHFSGQQLADLSARIDPDVASQLHYYPLLKAGERFPVNEPQLEPKLEPRPLDDAEFLKGMLEAMARIEKQGYDALHRLGAPSPKRLFTAGGGAKNAIWSAIRARHVDAQMVEPRHSEAAVGAAQLCLLGSG
ncbi:MAG: FGGY-family carbohydrate kinase [Pseudomonadota bacterium]